MIRLFAPTALAVCLGVAAQAQVRLEGWFIAFETCEVFQSKNTLTNPGDLRADVRHAYDILGRNTEDGDWYQMRVPGAPVTPDRWIHKDCGVHVLAMSQLPGGSDPDLPDLDLESGTEATDLLLAASWQPAFCEQRPDKTECERLNDGLLPITETQLSLHGLWPQPNGTFYCGVPGAIVDLDKDGNWEALPAPQLDADTADRLVAAMPGTASFLERHEWIKHGTCFFGDRNGDEYYDDSLRVLDAINASSVGALLAASVGNTVSGVALRAAFDDAFGAGAGDRVTIECNFDDGRVLIQELKIALKGEITETSDIGALIRAADPRDPGCSTGVIDPAGLQ
ncbi:MAG: ribonuclease T [Pseudomonadota bacterium]